jgi:hypothetical protein
MTPTDDTICGNTYCEHPFREHLAKKRGTYTGYGPCLMAGCPCQRFIRTEAAAPAQYTPETKTGSHCCAEFNLRAQMPYAQMERDRHFWQHERGYSHVRMERDGTLIVTVVQRKPLNLKVLRITPDGAILLQTPEGVRLIA